MIGQASQPPVDWKNGRRSERNPLTGGWSDKWFGDWARCTSAQAIRQLDEWRAESARSGKQPTEQTCQAVRRLGEVRSDTQRVDWKAKDDRTSRPSTGVDGGRSQAAAWRRPKARCKDRNRNLPLTPSKQTACKYSARCALQPTVRPPSAKVCSPEKRV